MKKKQGPTPKKKVARNKEFRYYAVYKPFKVLSQFSDPVGGKRTLKDLFPFPSDVYPVGRLDEDSEGLLLLSNDPRVNQKYLGQEVEKEYWVQVEGEPTEEALQALREGVRIRVRKKDHDCLPAQVECLHPLPPIPDRDPPIRYRKNVPDTWLRIVIREGKNRQVRKMTAAVGYPTLRLLRWRIGDLTLGDLQTGEVRDLPRL